MTSQAQREPYPDTFAPEGEALGGAPTAVKVSAAELPARVAASPAQPLSEAAQSAAELRRIALERLAAHRSRRAGGEAPTVSRPVASPVLTPAAQRVREAVAARYRQAPSYKDYLVSDTAPAEPVRAAVPPAAAAVEPPAWPVKETFRSAPPALEERVEPARPFVSPVYAPPVYEPSVSVPEPVPQAPVLSAPAVEVPLQVRFQQEIAVPEPPPLEDLQVHPGVEAATAQHTHELEELDEEIAFRFDPEFHEHLLEPLPIQANIIEFPRQLVATKKARPRLAEGPLRETEPDIPVAAAAVDTLAEPPADAAEPQLRIFEVEPEAEEEFAGERHGEVPGYLAEPAWQEPETQTLLDPEAQRRHEEKIRMMVELDELEASPEWQRLVLDARPEEDEAPSWVPAPKPEMPPAWKAMMEGRIELRVAPFELRFMATVVDGLCMLAAGLLFVTAASLAMGTRLHHVSLEELAITLTVMFVVLFVLYQWLFFTLLATTPGMFYAELVFRSLKDGDPTRSALHRRIFANLLAALPLGVGYLWMVFDREHLGWHDRLSGTYLREF